MIEKIKKAVETVKELQKLVAQLEKLTIQIVSIVGWILILIHLFNSRAEAKASCSLQKS